MQILLNGSAIDVVDWSKRDYQTNLTTQSSGVNRLDILVENCGRVNYAEFGSSILNEQRKGVDSVCHKQAEHLLNDAPDY